MKGQAARGSDCRILVVTVAYRSSGVLAEHIHSIRRASVGTLMRHVVVDNSEEPLASRIVAELAISGHPDLQYISNGGNPGYGAGANLGWSLADKDEYVLVVNPDLVLDPGRSLRMLVDAIDSDPRVILVCPTLTGPDGRVLAMYRGTPTPWNYPKWVASSLRKAERDPRTAMRRTLNVSGSAMLFSPDFSHRLGMFDEAYFLFMEDVDISRRVTEAGYLAVELGSVSSRHIGGVSMATVDKSAVATQSLVARALYFRKYFGRQGMRIGMMWALPEAVVYAFLRIVRYRRARHLREIGQLLRLGKRIWSGNPVEVQDRLVRPLFGSTRLTSPSGNASRGRAGL